MPVSYTHLDVYKRQVEESVDKRSKLYKAAAKCGNPVEFKEQTDEILAKMCIRDSIRAV